MCPEIGATIFLNLGFDSGTSCFRLVHLSHSSELHVVRERSWYLGVVWSIKNPVVSQAECYISSLITFSMVLSSVEERLKDVYVCTGALMSGLALLYSKGYIISHEYF